ncbi:TRAP transporter large permease [Arenibaculum pallidiluteum]|uniref:TRAP transporter large permease n=1 Tax=Arenibaculum pallidiluteum TaxID=2812559 RepID=UPI001A971880|nr:TRAP transporter large permease [Arenibaculum pallidiluteum]
MPLVVLFGSLLVMMLSGVPIAVALAGSSLAYVWMVGMPDVVVLHRMVNGIDSFPLLAIPFFIMAGNLMNSALITERIYTFAVALVGWMRGGLGHVNVAGSVIFAGMSGTAVADAGGLGTIEIKAMRDHGYDDRFAVGLTAASSTIGPIIPPSLPLVIYGVMANASVGQLFAAGVVPGLGMALILMLYVAYVARRRGYQRDARFSVVVLGQSFKQAFLALMTPVILIGGMVSGMFTPTEAAIAAVAWALFLGIAVYRTLTWRELVKVSMETIETTSVILIIVAAASIFGWILTSARVTEMLSAWVLGLTTNPFLLLLLVNLLLLFVGCFLETIAAITIMVPVLLPIMAQIGVDPVQFGILMVLNLMIGLLTPPVGMVLYILSRVARIPFEECAKACAPFLVPLLIILALVTYWPDFSMWLPTLIYR